MKENDAGRARLTLHAAAFIGAAAMLFFHPGALQMERIKMNLLLCVTLPLLLLFSGPRRLGRALTAPLSPGLAFFAALPLLLAWSAVLNRNLAEEGLALLAGILTLMALCVVVRAEGRRESFVLPTWLLMAGSLAALLGLVQAGGWEPFYLENPNHEAVSTLGNTNDLAEIAALLIPLSCVFVLARRRGPLLFGAATLSLLGAALWLSGGRGGVLAALCGVAAFLAAALRSACLTRRGLLGLASALLGGAVLVLLVSAVRPEEEESMKRRLLLKNIDSESSIFSPEYPTNVVRLEIARSTVNMILDRPLFGAGAGRFRMAFPPYRNPEEAKIPGLMGARTEVENPHNEFLWAAAEAGVPAALALAIFLVLVLRRHLRAAGDDDEGARRIMGCGVAGAAAAFAVLCLVSAPLHNPGSAVIFFLILGMGEPLREIKSERRRRAGRVLAPVLTVLLIGVSLWLGGRGLASDWLAASVGLKERIKITVYPDRIDTGRFADFQRAADLDPSNIDIIHIAGQKAADYLMGTVADRDGRFTREAERRMVQVLRRHPLHPGALKTLSRICVTKGRIASARRLLERYLLLGIEERSLEELLQEYLEEAGRAWERRGHFSRAADFYMKAYEGNPQGMIERAGVLYEEGEDKLAAAAVYLDRFQKENPMDPRGLKLVNDFRGTFDSYLLKGEGIVEEGEPLIERAEALFEEGKNLLAVSSLYADRYLEEHPLDGDALFLLGRCLKASHGTGEEDAFRRMHLAYALDWIEKGDWRQAGRSVRSSLRYGEGGGEAHLLSSIIEEGKGGAFKAPKGGGENRTILNRLKRLAAEGKLPEGAAAFVKDR